MENSRPMSVVHQTHPTDRRSPAGPHHRGSLHNHDVPHNQASRAHRLHRQHTNVLSTLGLGFIGCMAARPTHSAGLASNLAPATNAAPGGPLQATATNAAPGGPLQATAANAAPVAPPAANVGSMPIAMFNGRSRIANGLSRIAT